MPVGNVENHVLVTFITGDLDGVGFLNVDTIIVDASSSYNLMYCLFAASNLYALSMCHAILSSTASMSYWLNS